MESFMTVDHRIACQSEDAESARVLAGFMFAIFNNGVPLGFLTLLFRKRHEIMERKSRSGDTKLGYIGESIRKGVSIT